MVVLACFGRNCASNSGVSDFASPEEGNKDGILMGKSSNKYIVLVFTHVVQNVLRRS